jgi:hypothetical protein
LDELPITPGHSDGDVLFTVTHPCHPLFGQQFLFLGQRFTWSEPRVFFRDPVSGRIRSLPAGWTDLAPPDPFLRQAAGRAILRLSDLQALQRLLADLQAAWKEVAG